MKRLSTVLALAAAALLLPAALRAQDRPPRDTIRIVTGEREESTGDSITLVATGDSAARRARWSQPFSVRGSGRVAPRPSSREVVWLHPDSVRARARRAARDEEAADPIAAPVEEADSGEVVIEVPAAERPSRRRNTEETRASREAEADEDEAAEDEEAEAAPRRPTGRNASRDTAATTRRTPSRTPRADTASTRRTTTERADSAATRRTTAAGRPRSHTVASGETLFGIARRYSVTSAQIRALNPDVEWESLRVGTVLRLPAAARASGSTPARPAESGERTTPTPQRTTNTQRRRTHTVAQGETLYGIARRYGVTVAALKEANDLEADRVRIGQTLVIPRAQEQ